jgi:hypothetical protein
MFFESSEESRQTDTEIFSSDVDLNYVNLEYSVVSGEVLGNYEAAQKS